MSKKSIFWDQVAKSFHGLSSRSKAHKAKYFLIAKNIMETKPKNVIDLGCGSGLLENELIKLGYSGTLCAIDSSAEMLKIAKSICGDKVDFIRADLDKSLDISDKFEVAVAINVLFFLEDKEKFFSNVHNFLSNSSSIFILVNPKPNKDSSNWKFVKAHFSNTNTREKIFITINEFFNIPRYFRMMMGDLRLNRMADRGIITYDQKEDIMRLASDSGFTVRSVVDIHAGQNWLFLMSKR